VSLAKDFRGLSSEMRMAAAAAAALAVSLVLPWYQKSYFQGGKVVQANVSALGVSHVDSFMTIPLTRDCPREGAFQRRPPTIIISRLSIVTKP